MDFLIFVISIAILVTGADMLIRSSNALARRLNISYLIMGAFLVAIGASLPEMGVALRAHSDGKTQMAIATLLGSTLLNMTLIFGSIFIFFRSTLKHDFFTKDALWLLVALILSLLVFLDQTVSYFDAIILLAFILAYILFLIEDTKRGEFLREILDNGLGLPSAIMLFLGGFTLLVIGSIFTVDSVSDIATQWGFDRWKSGIVLIAFATALPELLLTLLALYKQKVEIAIANILGSSISNLTLVIALTTLVKPIHIDLSLHLFDIITMSLATLVTITIILTKSYNRYIVLSLFLILALFIEKLLF